MEEILTIKRVANILELSDRTVGDSVRNGELRAYKQFGKWYVLQSDLVAFIKQGKTKHRKPEKVDFSVFNESLSANEQTQGGKVEKPVKTFKSIKKQPNTSKHFKTLQNTLISPEAYNQTTYTRAVKNYSDIVEFMLSELYESVSQTALKFNVSDGLIKKIRKGMIELEMI